MKFICCHTSFYSAASSSSPSSSSFFWFLDCDCSHVLFSLEHGANTSYGMSSPVPFVNVLWFYIIRWEGRNNESFNLLLIGGGLVGLLGFEEKVEDAADHRERDRERQRQSEREREGESFYFDGTSEPCTEV